MSQQVIHRLRVTQRVVTYAPPGMSVPRQIPVVVKTRML